MEKYFKAPKLKPGSTLWLAANEFKRSIRSRNTNSGPKAIIGRIVFFCVMAFACYGAGQALYMILKSGNYDEIAFHYAAGKKLILGFIALFFMSMMTSFMFMTDRGDLDLLLSSPTKPENIISGRLLVSSWRTIMLFWFFGTLFIGVSAIMVSPKYFSYIPVAIGLSLFEAGLTFILARWFLMKFGLRFGRIFVQILGFAGVFGGVYFGQVNSTHHARSSSITSFAIPEGEFPKPIQDFLIWIGGSVLGDWFVSFCIMAFGAIVYLIIASWIGKKFGSDVSWLSGQSETKENKAKKDKKIKFEASFLKLMFKKEMAGIFRDSTAIVQIVAPIAGILPAIFALLSAKDSDPDLFGYIGTPIIVFLSASMSASLAWMIVSVEEANELLNSSPIPSSKIYTYKALIALIPGMVEVSFFSIGMAFLNPKAAILTFVFGLIANINAIAVEFANPKPTKRPKMMQKPDRSLASIFIGIFTILIWAIAASLANYSLLWALIPSAIAASVFAWSVMFNKSDTINHAKAIWGEAAK